MAIGNFPEETIQRSGNFKIHIIARPWNDEVEVWLSNVNNGKHFNCNIENSTIKVTDVPEGSLTSDFKPLMVVPYSVWGLIVQAVYNKETPPEKTAVDAELRATKDHLEDLRNLIDLFTVDMRIRRVDKFIDKTNEKST